jgi:hypothetical protein
MNFLIGEGESSQSCRTRSWAAKVDATKRSELQTGHFIVISTPTTGLP